MEATDIRDIESMKSWAIQHEGKVVSALHGQTETNQQTKQAIASMQADLKNADRRIQQWVGMGIILVPILSAVAGYIVTKLGN